MPRLQEYLSALRFTGGQSSFDYAACGIATELVAQAAARVDAAFWDLFLSETSMLEQPAEHTRITSMWQGGWTTLPRSLPLVITEAARADLGKQGPSETTKLL